VEELICSNREIIFKVKASSAGTRRSASLGSSANFGVHFSLGACLSNTRRGFRSLEDLTKDLTTRADDSHAAPVLNDYPVKVLLILDKRRLFVEDYFQQISSSTNR